MRLSISFVALLAASPAFAHDILTRADISAATVYSRSADVLRRIEIAVPAGTHRLLIAVPEAGAVDLPQVTAGEGVSVGPLTIERGIPIAEGALDTPAQAAARDALEAARDALREVQDRAALADARVRAGNLQITHLEALARGGEDGAEMPDADELGARLAVLGAEMARVAEEVQAAQIARRALNDELEDRQADVQAAQFALDALNPFGPTVEVLAMDVTAEADVTTAIEVTHGSAGASWAPRYDLRLDSGTGALQVDRLIGLSLRGTERWEDVAVTFSTANPDRPRDPSMPVPSPARIAEPAPRPNAIAREAEGGLVGALSSIAPAPVVADDAGALLQIDGLSVSYVYQRPVTAGASGDVLLPFDSLGFDAELTNLAVPRRNTTAFLLAAFENDSGEPLLPGETRFFRDGDLIGQGWLDLIAAGAETELAFGPLDQIRLDWQDLSLDEGDRGIFVQSNTQERRVAFTVENTSGEAVEVQVLYATPFAEQEDLDLEVTYSQAPDGTDWEGLRGVQEWQMSLAPGAERTVTMTFAFDWPEGQILNWRP